MRSGFRVRGVFFGLDGFVFGFVFFLIFALSRACFPSFFDGFDVTLTHALIVFVCLINIGKRLVFFNGGFTRRRRMIAAFSSGL